MKVILETAAAAKEERQGPARPVLGGHGKALDEEIEPRCQARGGTGSSC
jgi:hypothetical protein